MLGAAEKRRGQPQAIVVKSQPIWGMMYADDAGIASGSRVSLAKMMADIVAVCGSFGLTVSEAKTEAMCLMTKGMDRVISVTEAASQVYKQTAKLVDLAAAVCENTDLLRISNGACCRPTYGSDDIVCHCVTSPPHHSGSTYGCSKPRWWRLSHTGVSRGAPPWPISPYYRQLSTDCSSAALYGREHLSTATICFHRQTRWPRLIRRTSRRRCESEGHFSRVSQLVSREIPQTRGV